MWNYQQLISECKDIIQTNQDSFIWMRERGFTGRQFALIAARYRKLLAWLVNRNVIVANYDNSVNATIITRA